MRGTTRSFQALVMALTLILYVSVGAYVSPMFAVTPYGTSLQGIVPTANGGNDNSLTQDLKVDSGEFTPGVQGSKTVNGATVTYEVSADGQKLSWQITGKYMASVRVKSANGYNVYSYGSTSFTSDSLLVGPEKNGKTPDISHFTFTFGSVIQTTTVAPTTAAPTTAAPTTAAPTTAAPTTAAPTTAAPTTEAPTTEAPTTEAPTTEAPTTEAPTTEAPTTEAPTTEAPTTEVPTTETPTTAVSSTTQQSTQETVTQTTPDTTAPPETSTAAPETTTIAIEETTVPLGELTVEDTPVPLGELNLEQVELVPEDEIVVLDDIVPLGDAQLPQTGESSPFAFFMFGISLMALGWVFSKTKL